MNEPTWVLFMNKSLAVIGLAATFILPVFSTSIAGPERVSFPKADLQG